MKAPLRAALPLSALFLPRPGSTSRGWLTRAAFFLALTGAAHATSETWNGTVNPSSWESAGNWNSGAGPVPGSTSGTTSTDTATFNSATGVAVTIDSASQNIGTISFDTAAGGFTIGATPGNSLLLTSGGAIQILSTTTSTNKTETVNAPLVLEGGGTYTFANNSANGTGAGSALLSIGGGVTAGSASGTTTLALNGSNTNANLISGIIDNGSTGAVVAVTKSGAGLWDLSASNTYAGLTTVSSGTLTSTLSGSGSPFGTGSILVNGGTLNLTPGASGATTLTGASDPGATFNYDGGTLAMTAAASGTVTFTVGNAAATSSTLVRQNDGALIIKPDSIANLGVSEKFIVNGGVPTISNNNGVGVVSAAIVSNSGDFLSYNATSGFFLPSSNFYTAHAGSFTTSANEIANMTAGGTITQGLGNALDLRFSSTNPTVTLASTVTLGNGVNPAGILATGGGTITGGTLAFGSSEGIFYNFGATNLTISSALSGTNGITIVNASSKDVSFGGTVTVGNVTVALGTIRATGGTSDFSSDTLTLLPGGGFNAGGSGIDTIFAGLTDPSTGGSGLVNLGANDNSGGVTKITLAGSGNYVFSGNINIASGKTQSLLMNGTGTQTLAGTDQAGLITSAGTLILAGTQTSTADSVNSGGTFKVTGTTNQTVTVNSGGVYSIGNGGSTGADTAGGITDTGTVVFNRSDAAGTYAGVISGTAGSVIEAGTGTFSLTGKNTYTGGTSVNAGTLLLDFSSSSATTNIINNSANSSALTLGGGTLAIKGKASGTNSQQFNGTTFATDTASAIALTQNGATSVSTSLGALTRNTSSTVDITFPSAGNVTTTSTTFVSNGVLVSAASNGVAFATANGGATWATNSTGTLGALSSYATGIANYTSTSNVDVASGDSVAGVTVNTLRFNSAGDALTLSGVNTVATGGILDTAAGTGASLSGGTLESGGGNELVFAGYGTMTVSSTIADSTNGPSVLTKSGSGTLTLSSGNTYTGGTAVTAGMLLLNNGSSGSATGTSNGPLFVAHGAGIGGAGTSNSSTFAINGNIMVGNGIDATSKTTITGTNASTIANANLTFNLASDGSSANVLALGATNINFSASSLTLNVTGSGVIAPFTTYSLITDSAGFNAATDGLSLTLINGQEVITGGLSLSALSQFGASSSSAYGGSYLYLDPSGNAIDVEVVPEPGTWALMFAGLSALVFWQRRKSKFDRGV